MQSQQKRVKWSRGETSSAIQERTDTGITAVSVARMQNIITDLYGNISRRPALKMTEYATGVTQNTTAFKSGTEIVYPVKFYINVDDYIIFLFASECGEQDTTATYYRVKGGKIVYTSAITGYTFTGPYNYAQYNNFLILNDDKGSAYKVIADSIGETAISFTFSQFEWSGSWYAPEGTKLTIVRQDEIANLKFKAAGAKNIAIDDSTYDANVFTSIDSSVPQSGLENFAHHIPVGSLVKFPNAGSYMRVEGYYVGDGKEAFFGTIFDGVLNENETVPSTGTYCKAGRKYAGLDYYWNLMLYKYVNGVKVAEREVSFGTRAYVRNSASSTGYSSNKGGDNRQTICRWTTDATHSGNIWLYGEMLTTIADDEAEDTEVQVEKGFVSTSSTYDTTDGITGSTVFTASVFSQQRLYIGGLIGTYSTDGETYKTVPFSSLALGSHIARYDDFKNNYNNENEPITIDIASKYQERVLYLADSNGLKIFTDASEYSYTDSGGAVKQSENGALVGCQPLNFKSVLLYADKSGKNIRAMQYEMGSDVFESSAVNKFTQEDLIDTPIALTNYEDKTHCTGTFLFVVNKPTAEINPMAVCNLNIETQNMIWQRWTMPISNNTSDTPFSTMRNSVAVGNKVYFVVGGSNNKFGLAELDYEQVLDYDAPIVNNTYTPNGVIMNGGTVDLYDGDTYKGQAIIDAQGELSVDTSEYENAHCGFRVDAELISHPLDINGKTKTTAKRLARTHALIRNTQPGAFSINGKYGYFTNDEANFYACSGMNHEVRYTIKNKQGAKFTIESLTLNMEYGTLD